MSEIIDKELVDIKLVYISIDDNDEPIFQTKLQLVRSGWKEVIYSTATVLINVLFENQVFENGHPYVFRPFTEDEEIFDHCSRTWNVEIDHFVELDVWCKENIKGVWWFIVNETSDQIVFTNETDLVLFKLLYC